MAKTATAEAPALTAQQAKEQALARMMARRRAPRVAEYPDPKSGMTSRVQVDDGGFAEPRDLSEWVDDRIAKCPLGLSFDVLIEVLEALRGGKSAVAEAVDVAAQGSGDVQFAVRQNLAAFFSLPGAPAEVTGLHAAVKREWERRGLATRPDQYIVNPMDRDSPSPAARQVKYRSEFGQPAGLAV